MSVLIYSGGLDSTVALYSEKPKLAVSFIYGSNHSQKEIECAKYNCDALGIQHKIIDLSNVFAGMSSSLLGNGEVPEGHYEDSSMRSTVVPFRNGIMLACAVGIAEDAGYDSVILGAHTGDHAIYPDCRKPFVSAMSDAAEQGTYNHVKVKSPFSFMTKADIVVVGCTLRTPFERTWSCYKGGEYHCGKCGTCVERIEAFERSYVQDPTVYEHKCK